MSVNSRAVNVGLTATRLDTSTEDTSTRTAFACYNNSPNIVYVGGSGVTTSAGVPLAASSWGPSFDLWPGDAVYGIVASVTSEVRVVESGL